jgi:hypothetical protein
MTEPIVRLNLCPDCEHCPEVRVFEDRVIIGEEPHVAVLSKEQWAILVQAARQGIFDQAIEASDCPCTPGCCCCGSCPL